MLRFLTLILVLISIDLNAQNISTDGKFLSDSLKLGESVKYSLTVTHGSEIQILFPDSSYKYYPFELIKKDFYPTISNNGTSIDSAVYELRTFELKSILELSLPVFIIEDHDTTLLYCRKDSIFLIEYLPETPVTYDFKEDISFYNINQDFNYVYFLSLLFVIIISISIIYFLFGKTIRKRYRLFIIRIDHNTFLKNFQKIHQDFTSNQTSLTVEKILAIWKAYLARLEGMSINTFTTTEIINLYNNEELKNGLNVIDKAIYGGVVSNETEKAIVILRRFSVRQYHKRKRETQNA